MTFDSALTALRAAQESRRAAEKRFAAASKERGGMPESVVDDKHDARERLREALEDVMRASDREFVRRL